MVTGVRISGPGLKDIIENIVLLADTEVLVGVPDANADRDPDPDSDEDPTNATLAFIHDQGAPEANIPQREFMAPGIEAVEDRLTEKLGQTAVAVLRGGGAAKVEQGLAQVGIIAAVSIRNFIVDGIPPPLSDRTLRQRTKNKRKDGGGARKGAKQELANRARGELPSLDLAKPLVDTNQLTKSITYAIRSRAARKKD